MVRARAARRSATRATVFCQDLVELTLPEPVDVAFSNATFHWIPDHDALFAALHRNMKPGGRLLAQCGGTRQHRLVPSRSRTRSPPRSRSHPTSRTGSEPWNYADAPTRRSAPDGVQASARSHAGCRTSRPRSPIRGSFVSTVCLVRHLDPLPDELRERFVDEVLEATRRPGEPLLLEYVRLNMSAVRA